MIILKIQINKQKHGILIIIEDIRDSYHENNLCVGSAHGKVLTDDHWEWVWHDISVLHVFNSGWCCEEYTWEYLWVRIVEPYYKLYSCDGIHGSWQGGTYYYLSM